MIRRGLSASHKAPAQHAMAAHCSSPSGSPLTAAPVTMATMGTMIDDRPATWAGSMPTMENQARLPMHIGTRVM